MANYQIKDFPAGTTLQPTHKILTQSLSGTTEYFIAEKITGLIILTETSTSLTLTRYAKQYLGLNTLPEEDSNSSEISLSTSSSTNQSTSSSSNLEFTIFLPPSPQEGDEIEIKDQNDNASNKNILIHGNGKQIDNENTFTVNVDGQALKLRYAFGQWRIF